MTFDACGFQGSGLRAQSSGLGICLDIRVSRRLPLGEVVKQIAENNDQEECAKAAWFFVPMGLACRQAICCKSVSKQVSVHNSLPFDDPG